jgi:hypothetical protein
LHRLIAPALPGAFHYSIVAGDANRNAINPSPSRCEILLGSDTARELRHFETDAHQRKLVGTLRTH